MIVGLTGGIGSGKSEVSRRFEQLGIRVVDADLIARLVVMPNNLALNSIVEHFGNQLLQADKTLDRAKLRAIIFEHPHEKIWLENLLHPIIRRETISQLDKCDGPYVILSSPLLLETDQHTLVDRILVVDSPEELQLLRASSRDNNNRTQIGKIMAAQLSRQERCTRADDIINNSSDLAELDRQVQLLHHKYLTLAATSP